MVIKMPTMSRETLLYTWSRDSVICYKSPGVTELGDMTHIDKKDLGSKVGRERGIRMCYCQQISKNGYKMVWKGGSYPYNYSENLRTNPGPLAAHWDNPHRLPCRRSRLRLPPLRREKPPGRESIELQAHCEAWWVCSCVGSRRPSQLEAPPPRPTWRQNCLTNLCCSSKPWKHHHHPM